jgi:hypothetical protein
MRSLITAGALVLGFAATAQNYNDLVEVVRSDVRTQKQAIVMSALDLTEAQSAVFAPIYDEYTGAMKTHWDKRLQLIKDYAAKLETMNDEVASSLMKRSNALEKENLSIRDKYAKKVAKVLPATIAARWMQVESRLGKLIDLQMAQEIPLVPTKK